MKRPTNWAAITAAGGWNLSTAFLSAKAKAQLRDSKGRFIPMGGMIRWMTANGWRWGFVVGYDADNKWISVQENGKNAVAKISPKAHQLEVVKALIPSTHAEATQLAEAQAWAKKIADEHDPTHPHEAKAKAKIPSAPPHVNIKAVDLSPVSDDDDTPTLYVDTDGFKKVGGQAGSNPGGVYEDPKTGERFYVKKAQSEQHAANEVLAARLYQKAGVKVPDVYLTDLDGEPAVASRIIPDMQPLFPGGHTTPETLKEGRKGFAMDAWLANWDSVGLVYDNLMKDKDGHAVRVDTGGALLYRAQGAPKGGIFGDKAGETETLRSTKNAQSHKIFGGMTDEEVAADVAATVNKISDKDVHDLVAELPFSSDKVKSDLEATLKARKKDINDKFKIPSNAKPKPDLAGHDPLKKPNPDDNVMEIGLPHSPNVDQAELSENEEEILDGYIGDYYEPLNEFLRTGSAPKWFKGHSDEQLQQYAGVLDGLVAKSQTKNASKVFRGVDATGWLEDVKPGTELIDKGYMSTSSKSSVAIGFVKGDSGDLAEIPAVLEIDVPAGTHVIDVKKSGLGGFEDEFLFGRGGKLTVTETDVLSDGTKYIKANLTEGEIGVSTKEGLGDDSGGTPESPGAPDGVAEEGPGGPASQGQEEVTAPKDLEYKSVPANELTHGDIVKKGSVMSPTYFKVVDSAHSTDTGAGAYNVVQLHPTKGTESGPPMPIYLDTLDELQQAWKLGGDTSATFPGEPVGKFSPAGPAPFTWSAADEKKWKDLANSPWTSVNALDLKPGDLVWVGPTSSAMFAKITESDALGKVKADVFPKGQPPQKDMELTLHGLLKAVKGDVTKTDDQGNTVKVINSHPQVMPEVEQPQDDHWSMDQVDVLEGYTSDAYLEINHFARTGSDEDKNGHQLNVDHLDWQIAVLDDMIAQATTQYDSYVYRGASSKHLLGPGEYEPGDLLVDQAFLSTSSSFHTAKNFPLSKPTSEKLKSPIIEIFVPKGANVLDTSQVGIDGGESEFIFPRNTVLVFKEEGVLPDGRRYIRAHVDLNGDDDASSAAPGELTPAGKQEKADAPGAPGGVQQPDDGGVPAGTPAAPGEETGDPSEGVGPPAPLSQPNKYKITKAVKDFQPGDVLSPFGSKSTSEILKVTPLDDGKYEVQYKPEGKSPKSSVVDGDDDITFGTVVTSDQPDEPKVNPYQLDYTPTKVSDLKAGDWVKVPMLSNLPQPYQLLQDPTDGKSGVAAGYIKLDQGNGKAWNFWTGGLDAELPAHQPGKDVNPPTPLPDDNPVAKIGAVVKSKKDGFTGTVVNVNPTTGYSLVLSTDGSKKLWRSWKTLAPAEAPSADFTDPSQDDPVKEHAAVLLSKAFAVDDGIDQIEPDEAVHNALAEIGNGGSMEWQDWSTVKEYVDTWGNSADGTPGWELSEAFDDLKDFTGVTDADINEPWNSDKLSGGPDGPASTDEADTLPLAQAMQNVVNALQPGVTPEDIGLEPKDLDPDGIVGWIDNFLLNAEFEEGDLELKDAIDALKKSAQLELTKPEWTNPWDNDEDAPATGLEMAAANLWTTLADEGLDDFGNVPLNTTDTPDAIKQWLSDFTESLQDADVTLSGPVKDAVNMLADELGVPHPETEQQGTPTPVTSLSKGDVILVHGVPSTIIESHSSVAGDVVGLFFKPTSVGDSEATSFAQFSKGWTLQLVKKADTGQPAEPPQTFVPISDLSVGDNVKAGTKTYTVLKVSAQPDSTWTDLWLEDDVTGQEINSEYSLGTMWQVVQKAAAPVSQKNQVAGKDLVIGQNVSIDGMTGKVESFSTNPFGPVVNIKVPGGGTQSFQTESMFTDLDVKTKAKVGDLEVGDVFQSLTGKWGVTGKKQNPKLPDSHLLDLTNMDSGKQIDGVPYLDNLELDVVSKATAPSPGKFKPGDHIYTFDGEYLGEVNAVTQEQNPSGVTLSYKSAKFGSNQLWFVNAKHPDDIVKGDPPAGADKAPETPGEPTKPDIPTGTLVPGSDHVYQDAQGKFTVTKAGQVLREGMTVKSLKDGFTGEIVQLETGPRYAKVKGPDGKIKGRQLDTLEPVEKPAPKASKYTPEEKYEKGLITLSEYNALTGKDIPGTTELQIGNEPAKKTVKKTMAEVKPGNILGKDTWVGNEYEVLSSKPSAASGQVILDLKHIDTGVSLPGLFYQSDFEVDVKEAAAPPAPAPTPAFKIGDTIQAKDITPGMVVGTDDNNSYLINSVKVLKDGKIDLDITHVPSGQNFAGHTLTPNFSSWKILGLPDDATPVDEPEVAPVTGPIKITGDQVQPGDTVYGFKTGKPLFKVGSLLEDNGAFKKHAVEAISIDWNMPNWTAKKSSNYMVVKGNPADVPQATAPETADSLTGTLVPGSSHVYQDAKGKYVVNKYGHVLREGMQVTSTKDGLSGKLIYLELGPKYAKVQGPTGLKGRQIDTLKPAAQPTAVKNVKDYKVGDKVLYKGKPATVTTTAPSNYPENGEWYLVLKPDGSPNGIGEWVSGTGGGVVQPLGSSAPASVTAVKSVKDYQEGDKVLWNGQPGTVDLSQVSHFPNKGEWYLAVDLDQGGIESAFLTDDGTGTAVGKTPNGLTPVTVTPAGAPPVKPPKTFSGDSVKLEGGKTWKIVNTVKAPQLKAGQVVGNDKKTLEYQKASTKVDGKWELKFVGDPEPLTVSQNIEQWQVWEQAEPGKIGKMNPVDFSVGQVIELEDGSKHQFEALSEWGDTPGKVDVKFKGQNVWVPLLEDASYTVWEPSTPTSPDAADSPGVPEEPAGPVQISHEPIDFVFPEGGEIKVPPMGTVYKAQYYAGNQPILMDGFNQAWKVNPVTGELSSFQMSSYWLKNLTDKDALIVNPGQADVTPNLSAVLSPDDVTMLEGKVDEHLKTTTTYYKSRLEALKKLLGDPTGESLTTTDWDYASVALSSLYTLGIDEGTDHKWAAYRLEVTKLRKKVTGTYTHEWSNSAFKGQYFYDANERKALGALGLSPDAQAFVDTKNTTPSQLPDASAEIHAVVSDPARAAVIDDLFGLGTSAKITKKTRGQAFMIALSGNSSPYAKQVPDLPKTEGKNGTVIYLGDNVVAPDGQGGQAVLVTPDGKVRVRRADGSHFTRKGTSFVPTGSPISSTKPTPGVVGETSFTLKPRPEFQAPDWSKGNVGGTATLQDVLAKIKASDRAGNIGWSFAGDAGQVEDLDVHVSRVLSASGQELLELKFKFSAKHGNAMFKRHSVDDKWTESLMKIDGRQLTNSNKLAQLTGATTYSGHGGRTLLYQNADGTEIRFHRANNKQQNKNGTNPVAFHNLVQVRVPATASQEDIAKALYDAGLDQPGPASPEAVKRLAENRLLSMFAKKTDAWVGNDGIQNREALLAGVKSEWGVTAEQLEIAHGANGRFEIRLPEWLTDKIVKKTGVNYFLHSLSGGYTDLWAKVGKNPFQALLSTSIRRTEGVKAEGSSSAADIHSGGADYVFTRPRGTMGKQFANSLVFSAKRLLRRMDWFSQDYDSWGNFTNNLDIIGKTTPGATETMFKHRLDLDDAVGYFVYDETTRQEIIANLKAHGVTHLGSRTVEEFIMIAPDTDTEPTTAPVNSVSIASFIGGLTQ